MGLVAAQLGHGQERAFFEDPVFNANNPGAVVGQHAGAQGSWQKPGDIQYHAIRQHAVDHPILVFHCLHEKI
jgi:hypothetical protein